MSRSDLDQHFADIDTLVREIEDLVPATSYKLIKFRADLSGLLVVAITATYENCVKEIMSDFADRQHTAFGGFARRNFEKLNSRIRFSDLKRYCDTFDPTISSKFSKLYKKRKDLILKQTGEDIGSAYERILKWRHAYAHTRTNNTTIEETAKAHMFAKRVLYCFDDAFNSLK